MQIYKSAFKRILKLRNFNSYILNLKSIFVYRNWFKDFIKHFILNIPTEYPAKVQIINSPQNIEVILWNDLDRWTLNEIFCWECYKLNAKEAIVILDLGGNIGLSAKYFLSKNNNSQVYIYEPNEKLINKIRIQLKIFGNNRFYLENKAIGIENSKGFLKKGYHSRYSYIEISDYEKDNLIPIISLENAIKNCINKFGRCDVLKIDIEGMGYLALNSINIDFSVKPKNILIEENVGKDLDLFWLKKNYIKKRNLSGIDLYELKPNF